MLYPLSDGSYLLRLLPFSQEEIDAQVLEEQEFMADVSLLIGAALEWIRDLTEKRK